MSTIKVEVTRINDVRPHANADALELATVGGWQMCVKKGVYQDGDPVVYFEQGTVLPREVADRLAVTQYLKERTDIDGNPVLVIHRVRLRGEPSFGLVVEPEPGMDVGQDVADFYGATKFEPPVRIVAGDSIANDPRFPAYTEVENLRSYLDVIAEGEEVVVTEKVHGTNCRVGFVAKPLVREGQDLYGAIPAEEASKEELEMVRMAGSRGLRRKEPVDSDAMRSNTYWYPWTIEGVETLLKELFLQGHDQAVLYGEVYGAGIQSYNYGHPGIAFRAFDLMVDGTFVDYDEFAAKCAAHSIETVPLLHRGPFSLTKVKELSDGDSLVGGKHGREGVVVKPAHERTDVKIGRVILKYVGDVYLFGKAAEQDTTDL
ncbi:MAG: RNA ligase (ATP) [Caldilineaceae bacterium]